jgi:hypothetical protein
MFWVSSQQFLFLGKPHYVRYLCRGLVVLCRAVEFCSVFPVPEGKPFETVFCVAHHSELAPYIDLALGPT